MKKLAYILIAVLLTGCQQNVIDLSPRNTQAEGFVSVVGDHFEWNGERWFPMMINYKVDWHQDSLSAYISPASYYDPIWGWEHLEDDYYGQLGAHLEYMEDSLHANAVRFCLDVVNSDEKGYFYGSKDNPIYLIEDSSRIFSAIGQLVETMRQHTRQVRAMLLIKAPLDEELSTFTRSLLAHFWQEPLIWAYDFMNEPLYFDPAATRDKMDAYRIVDGWRTMMNDYAPHQLFTIGFAEPIEVFEWDPTMMPVDFVEMHTYHPLRVASEMYWYGRFCSKPWMVGETSIPDHDIPYAWPSVFMEESFRCAVENGACGYGWWEFQDCPGGVNPEAQNAGLLIHAGSPGISPAYVLAKPTVKTFRTLDYRQYSVTHPCPTNYSNMLGYNNLAIAGKVVEKGTGEPIEGALIRGWNEDWSVGMNTFSDANGDFTLYSNDYCVHFEVSAPGMSHLKFDRHNLRYSPKIHDDQLKNRDLEYQQIDFRPFLVDEHSMLTFQSSLFCQALSRANIGRLTLKQL